VTQEQLNLLLKKILWAVIGLLTISFILIKPSLQLLLLKAIKPLFVAFAIAYMVDPIVRFLENKLKLSRKKSLAITLILLVFTIIILISIILPGLINSFSEFSTILNSESATSTFTWEDAGKILGINFTSELITEIERTVNNAMQQISSVLTTAIQTFLSSVVSFTSSIVSFFLAFIIAIYMLLTKDDLLNRFKRMIKAFSSKDRYSYLTHVSQTANDVFSSFFIGKIIDSAIIGALCWLIMALVKIPNAATFGFLIGLTNMIPYFGPIIGAVPCLLITLIISPAKALWVLIIIIVLQQFDGLVLGPKILGDKLGVDAFWIITAVTIGGSLGGVLGMLLGVPVVIFFKKLIEEAVDKRLPKK